MLSPSMFVSSEWVTNGPEMARFASAYMQEGQ